MKTKTQELVTAGYALAKGLDAESAKLVKELATELAVQRVRADELNKQVVSLAVENASLKSNLMFWDADNPELPYDSPEEIASECELNYNEELVVQVAAKLPNRTYRVCESWETDCKLELVEGADLQTPATDAAIANIQAQCRAEGIYFTANRLLAAWEHGFIDSPDKEVIDVARMILSAVEMLPDATEEDFERGFSDEIMNALAAQLRREAGNA